MVMEAYTCGMVCPDTSIQRLLVSHVSDELSVLETRRPHLLLTWRIILRIEEASVFGWNVHCILDMRCE